MEEFLSIVCFQGPSNDNLTADKKKVLKFFNEGGEQEMTGIQVGFYFWMSQTK